MWHEGTSALHVLMGIMACTQCAVAGKLTAAIWLSSMLTETDTDTPRSFRAIHTTII